MLVGHNTLRLMAMGLEDRAPNAAEFAQMEALLDEGLAAGALGFSSGLFTPPGSFAAPDELMRLCEVVRRDLTSDFDFLVLQGHLVLLLHELFSLCQIEIL